MHIKICDVKDVHTARLCGNAEVDMIGLHAIRKLKRKNIKPYRLICDEMRAHYTNTYSVLVTKIKDPKKLAGVLKRISIEFIQIYILDEKSLAILKRKLDKLESHQAGDEINLAQRQILDELVYELKCLKEQLNLMLIHEVKFILTLPILGINIKFSKYLIEKAQPLADLFLLDTTIVGGTGVTAGVENIEPLLKETQPNVTIIAGGLNPENVQGIIQNLNSPTLYGVDVQSGVADNDINRVNTKNPKLIIDFIAHVHSVSSESIKRKAITYPVSRRSLLSWAITDLQITENFPKKLSIMQKTDIDSVHIDFSNGSIAPNFYRMPFSLLEHFTYYFPCMNYDIHLFIENVMNQYTVITECLKRNVLLKTVYFHVLPDDNAIIEKVDLVSAFCCDHGIDFGLAIQSTQFTVRTLEELYKTVFLCKIRSQISEISLITHSKNHTLLSATEHDRQILNSILRNNEIFSIEPLISIDRDMNLEKAKSLLQTEFVNQIIIGKDFNNMLDLFSTEKTIPLAVRNIQTHISRYRKLLVNARNRNANRNFTT